MHAQIPNCNFEQATGYGLENVWAWGQPFSYPITIDLETGQSTYDQILFGEAAIGTFCLSVPDAHTGSRAMLIRNALNTTQNIVIPGNVNLFNTEISETPTGWNAGIPLNPDADIQYFSFWYKFAPIGNDVAEANLLVVNTNDEVMGTAKIQISEAANTYTYVSVPLTINTGGNPAFISITFSMAAEGSIPVFGSTLIVDDLSVNPTSLQTNAFGTNSFSVWPTVATQEINIQKNGSNSASQHFRIVNVEGKVVSDNQLKLQNGIAEKINISQLANGFYILKSDDGFTTKFIKK